MVWLDSFFFVVFSLISLFWWVPVIFIFFLPFIVAKKIKNKITQVSSQIEKLSAIKLAKFKTLKKMVEVGKKTENTSKHLYNRLASKAYQKTVWWQRMEIIEAVPYKARVLDIGCGNGYLAKILKQNKKAHIVCVDIDDFNQTEIPTILFDGVNLPFKDREFDIVILSFVLHHSEFQEELLSEAARVCKGKIIIYEDEAINKAKNLMATAHEKLWNFFTDQKGKVIYHTPEEWRQIFAQSHLEVMEEKREWGIGSFVIPLKKAIFVLKNKN